MPGKGRPRLTLQDLQDRVRAYCARYAVATTPKGLPPFPAGHRETPRHREWLALYKLHSRLGRRARGQCERCSAPATAGSVFCDEHRGGRTVMTLSGGAASLEERRTILAGQRGRCPICARRLALEEASPDAGPAAGPPRALLHATCAGLVGQARSLGPEALERLRAYLRPKT